MDNKSVTLEIPQGEGKPVFPWTYSKEVAETVGDCQSISKGVAASDEALKTDEEKSVAAKAYLVKAFNYGHDLLLRASERSKGARAAQGPEKEIAKGIKAMVENGFSPEQAREMVVAQRIATGKPV